MVRAVSYLLKNAFYDRVCDSLSKPSNEKMLFRYIAQFRDRNISTLSSPYITKIIAFNSGGEDANVLFRACGVTREEVDPVVKEALKVLQLDKTGEGQGDSKNVTAFRVILIMAMSFFFKDKEKLRALYLYYAYSLYYSVYSNYWISEDRINKECMEYTINNMSNKFGIKKEQSVEGMLAATLQVAVDTYSNLLTEVSDYDIVQIINAFKTRISHSMRNIRNQYEINYRNGDRYFESIEKTAEGEFIMDRENSVTMVTTLAAAYTTTFFQNPINLKLVKIVANMHEVSESEIRTAISVLHDEGDHKEVQRFYECMFQLFFEAYPNARERDINSNKFLVAADAIYKKGNSNDKKIIMIKDYTHKWLKRASNTYRSVTRAATINDYRKAIYMYFVLFVSTK